VKRTVLSSLPSSNQCHCAAEMCAAMLSTLQLTTSGMHGASCMFLELPCATMPQPRSLYHSTRTKSAVWLRMQCRPQATHYALSDSCAAMHAPDTLGSWLGNGLVSDLDAGHHGAMKEILLPAFKAQSVKDLVPLFVGVGTQGLSVLCAAAYECLLLPAPHLPAQQQAAASTLCKCASLWRHRPLHWLSVRLQHG
jgi:hypothetical protein